MRTASLTAVLLGLLQAACGGSSPAAPDTLALDLTSADSGTQPTVDSSAADAFAPLPGLGALAGACGVLDDEEWQAQRPFFFRNSLDFGNESYALEKLSAGGQEIVADDNLGGDSLLSEVFAFEVLHRCEGATLLKTEREIEYQDDGGKKTDLLLSIDGRKVGVSVTRAYHYPPEAPYTEQEASTLLSDKLPEVLLSAANAKAIDAWERSILHVIAYNAQYADAVQAVYDTLDATTRDQTILILTVTEGDDTHLY